MGVGGLTWPKAWPYLGGINLPEHQQHLGDQITDFHISGFHPHFIVIVLGSNDVDDLNTFIMEYWRQHQHETNITSLLLKFMNRWYKEIIQYIEHFFEALLENIPGADIRFIPIIERSYWSNYGITFSGWVNRYILRILGQPYGIKKMEVPRIDLHLSS